MTQTGIRHLALVVGAALVLAGCEAGKTAGPGDAGPGDAAAAALEAEDISTTSLDAPAAAEASDPAASAAAETAAATVATLAAGKPGPAATDPAAPDPAAADLAATDPAVTGTTATDAAIPADKPRKGLFGFLKPRAQAATAAAASPTPATARRNSVRMVDRDVEAPDVFSVTEPGLWDGRPSLGGVWVAYPDVTDPERVIIRNNDTGAFVIGALFRRERDNPGPKLQVSSDAATALGMLAGAPAKLNVTALRREEVVDPADAEALLATGSIDEQTIAPAPVTATAASAPAAKPAQPAATGAGDLSAAAPQPAAAAPPAPAKPASAATPGKPFLQVGIFSVESNADGTAAAMRKAGLTAKVVNETSQGKTFWRVLIGPAASTSEKDALLAKAKGLGFADAYFVSR